MKTKQIVMTSAHAIYKMQNVTFSEALIKAWRNFKANLMAVIVKSNKLIKSVGLGYETICFNELNFVQILSSRFSVEYNPAIEKYYGCGMFNND